MGWAARGCSDQRLGVCHISPLLRASLSNSSFWIAPLLMQAEMVVGGHLLSWTCLAHSTVPLMQQGICLSEIVAGISAVSPWSSQELSCSVELLVLRG